MAKPIFPTPKEIKKAIKEIKKTKPKNTDPAKEGFDYCLKLLNTRLENPENQYFIAETVKEWNQVNEIYETQIKGIEKLKELKSRSMAILCVDWLNGNKKGIAFLSQ